MSAVVDYVIREHQVGDFIVVEAWLYDTGPECGPELAASMRRISPEGIPCWPRLSGYVGNDPYTRYVHVPNWLMRLLGDTLDRRLARARAAVSSAAERTKRKEMMLWLRQHPYFVPVFGRGG